MRTLRTQVGPFPERPYYERWEIEKISIEALSRVGLLPTGPEPIRIDRLIEKGFGIVPRYKDLPGGILGYTRFGPDGTEKVVVSRSLSEVGSRASESLVSSTLAHEVGHILLHGHLFARKAQTKSRALFQEEFDVGGREILCREGRGPASNGSKGIPRYDGRWWEYQANQVMGSLLLPRKLFDMALEPLFSERGTFGLRSLPSECRDEAVQYLTEVFNVSPIVAQIRLDEAFPAADHRQLTL